MLLRSSYGAKPLMTQDIRWLRKSPTVLATALIGICIASILGAVVGSGGRGECGSDGYRQPSSFIWRSMIPLLASTLYHAIFLISGQKSAKEIWITALSICSLPEPIRHFCWWFDLRRWRAD